MTASLSRREANLAPGNPFPTHIIVFLAPAVIVYGLFMIYPLFDSLRLGFFAQVTRGVEQFVGFDNYVTLMTDDAILQPRLLNALKNSFLFFAVNMLIQNPIALMLAAVLSTKTRGGLLYRILIFSPAILSLAIAGFVWRLVLSPLWGIVYDMLKALGLGAYAQPWLGLESTALVTLALISAWQFLGIPMMLYFATLISIPNDLFEAAYVDGATDWQVFWRIKLPLLMPMVGIISLLTYIGNFNAFDVIFALKGADAGPNYASDTMMTFFYRTFFGSGFQKADPHMGAAVDGAGLRDRSSCNRRGCVDAHRGRNACRRVGRPGCRHIHVAHHQRGDRQSWRGRVGDSSRDRRTRCSDRRHREEGLCRYRLCRHRSGAECRVAISSRLRDSLSTPNSVGTLPFTTTRCGRASTTSTLQAMRLVWATRWLWIPISRVSKDRSQVLRSPSRSLRRGSGEIGNS